MMFVAVFVGWIILEIGWDWLLVVGGILLVIIVMVGFGGIFRSV
jgi:hypothetical protein